MKIKLLLVVFIFGNCLATIDYINKYFPEDSVIRKTHNSEPRGTGWFGFDNDIRSTCDNLNSIFSYLALRAHNDCSLWYLHIYDQIEKAIRKITQNQDEKTIRAELDWAWELKKYFDTKIEENYRKTAEYQQELEREQRLIAIRKAIEQKDS